jgi:hypothetical protein
LRAPASRAGRSARAAASLSAAVALVVALASGCAKTATPAPVADTTYGVPIEINTPQGLRAKQTIDMLNSEWPIITAGLPSVATASPRSATNRSVLIGYGSATSRPRCHGAS